MEVTGRYHLSLAEPCFSRGVPVYIVQPVTIRSFARSRQILAKSDKSDAAVIANYAVTMKPKATPAKGKNLVTIKDLLARKRQAMNLRTIELNRQQIVGCQPRCWVGAASKLWRDRTTSPASLIT